MSIRTNAYINLGTVFKELEETDKAMNCYIKAIEILPSLSYAHSNLGTIYKELGELEKSNKLLYKSNKI